MNCQSEEEITGDALGGVMVDHLQPSTCLENTTPTDYVIVFEEALETLKSDTIFPHFICFVFACFSF